MVPLAILSFYFHFQFNVTLKESGKLHLTTLAESQRNTIDLFLQERVVNVFNLFYTSDFKLRPSQEDMARYLQHLREMSDAFIDVGFLDSSGIQVGYTGPFPFLQGKDYSNEPWFQTLMEQNRNYHITDIYLGFRHKPHFTIAVKQILEGKPYVMRATLDPDKLYLFLRTIGKGKVADKANFITLTVYFAFIEGVTRIVTYTLIILTLIGVIVAVATPQFMGLVVGAVGTLFIALFIWTIALNIIVLMSAYGYGFLGAFFLALGAFFVRWIFMGIVRSQLGFYGL